MAKKLSEIVIATNTPPLCPFLNILQVNKLQEFVVPKKIQYLCMLVLVSLYNAINKYEIRN